MSHTMMHSAGMHGMQNLGKMVTLLKLHHQALSLWFGCTVCCQSVLLC